MNEPRRELRWAVLGALLAVALSLLLRASCSPYWWGRGAPHPYCYTEITALYVERGFARDAVPYLQAKNEYPVLTGIFAYGAALASSSMLGFLLVNAVALAILATSASVLLARMAGPRVAYFSFAPSLVVYAVLNWDLLAVALAIGAIHFAIVGRERLAGVLLGLGAAAKLYPALLVLPLAGYLASQGRTRLAVRLAGAAAIAWVAINLPFAVAAPRGWSFFFRLSASRPPTWGTLWSVGCRALHGTEWCPDVGLINLLWPIAFALLALGIWRHARRRSKDFPVWGFGLPLLVALLLTSKVYSPQYSLWLLPWFALVLPNLRAFLAYEVADLLVFFTEFSAQGAGFDLDPFPRWSLDVAVIVRAAVLVVILIQFMRDAGSGALTARSEEILQRLGMARQGRSPQRNRHSTRCAGSWRA